MDKNNRILASVALFSELYDRKQDIYHLVGEFIKAAIISERAWEFTIAEANGFLREHFDFYLPNAVLKKVLRLRLKTEGFIAASKGDSYRVANPNNLSNAEFSGEFNHLKSKYDLIQDRLIEYSKTFTSTDDRTQEEIEENFYHYLMGESVLEDLARLYSAFIVEFSSDQVFTDDLNLIREGLVIYSAVITAQEPNELGFWRSDLNVVLDTELLLTMGGFNGPAYEEFFNDFYNLVKEINRVNAARNKKARINLSYLEEGREEIERIFSKAESVLAGIETIHFTTTAYRSIFNGCSSPSDVLAKKAQFFRRLDVEGIRQIESVRLHERIPFNVEDQTLLYELCKDVRKFGNFDEGDIVARLEQFTVINRLRGGASSTQFEMAGALLLTGDRLTRSLGNDSRVKFSQKDAPFAIDIDYITNRLWFSLNKGFRDKASLPKSFDIVTRAQTVLAAQLRSAVNSRYSEYQERYQSGSLDREEALLILAEVRAQEIDPRTIDEESLEDVLDFISDAKIDEKVAQIHELQQVANNVPTLEFKLKSEQFHNFILRSQSFKSLLRILSGILNFALYSSPIYIFLLIYLLVRYL